MNDDDIIDDEHESADDALEEERAGRMFHPDTDEEKLADDFDPPSAPADDVFTTDAPQDEPASDTDEDADELYEEGSKEASSNSDRDIGPDERPRPLEPEE